MKKKCLICSKRFEPVRSDAKYCSNACKQKAFYNKLKKSDRIKIEKEVFYLSDYENYLKYVDLQESDFPFIFFCFLRRNLVDKADVLSIVKYINSIWTQPYDTELKRLMNTNAYKCFEESFLNREFIIKK